MDSVGWGFRFVVRRQKDRQIDREFGNDSIIRTYVHTYNYLCISDIPGDLISFLYVIDLHGNFLCVYNTC